MRGPLSSLLVSFYAGTSRHTTYRLSTVYATRAIYDYHGHHCSFAQAAAAAGTH